MLVLYWSRRLKRIIIIGVLKRQENGRKAYTRGNTAENRTRGIRGEKTTEKYGMINDEACCIDY
jgi:hypothetical protein